MEESDEPDQPISAGRQEIRKRRRPSQPMVDKSQQTEVTEKKKHLPISQSSGPKATLSIGNIPGTKVNYESLRVSSQLQQTWTKRKRVQDMTDKSLQTDATVEEKKEEIKSVGETVVPEEKPAAVEEEVPEFPESVQEVEMPPSRHSVQFKIDRSQQTSCTGDWTLMNIPQKEKVDKEQQTYFSETEIVVIGRPDSSFSKSNEVVQERKSSGKIFLSEHPELQPSTSKDEAIGKININRFLFSQQSIKGFLELSEDEQYVLGEIQPPFAEEISAEVQPPPAGKITEDSPPELNSPPTEEPPAEKSPAKVEPILGEEALSEGPPAEVQYPKIEEVPIEVQLSPAEETPTEEASAKVESIPAEEAFSKEAYVEIQPQSAEEPSTQEASELQFSSAVEAPAEEALAEVSSIPAEEGPAEEAPAEVQPPPAKEVPSEEALAQVQPPPAEEGPEEEAPDGIWYPPAEEAPEEEAPAEFWSPSAEEGPEEEAPDGIWYPPAEERPAEEAPAEIQFLPAEEGPAEEVPADIWSPPAEEAPKEDIPAEVWSAPAGTSLTELQHPSVEETTLEMVPVDKQFPEAKEDFITQISVEDVPAEVQPPPSEHVAVNEALVDHMSTGYQYTQTTDVPVVKLESLVLEDQQKPEEPLELDPAPEDLSNINKEQVPTYKIEGVLHVEIK
ncbi:fibrous sheath CABYR-binding protein isoform X6 [Mustela erminea]|uniref:fibrous sheath CABYR-binding protein isoform X6 n=1 Tax=Mustela erminea TaxID=36723 RepID=UPI001386E394|nr:fibrous sheath CABYR-binding protein isoform X6 [Mustela erminea]